MLERTRANCTLREGYGFEKHKLTLFTYFYIEISIEISAMSENEK